MSRTALQDKRLWFQAGFFLLFLLAPPLDMFRYDLTLGHAIVLGQPWTLGLDPFLNGQASALDAVLSILLRGLLPIAVLAAVILGTAWRWGRLYCGWMCPHFSVVEMINGLMLRASGKPSVWEPRALPTLQPDGRQRRPNRWYWIPTALAVLLFAFVWAVGLLTYLLPPAEVYSNLWHGTATRNQFIFITAATIVLSVEFGFARHLFCRYGCAVGLFQSLAWMANRRAMVVSLDRSRASTCKDCNSACDNACPMRLKPRTLKRAMFTCTECGECLSACEQVQVTQLHQPQPLNWVAGDAASSISAPPVSPPHFKKRSETD